MSNHNDEYPQNGVSRIINLDTTSILGDLPGAITNVPITLHEGGKLPEKKHTSDAGFDCYVNLKEPVRITPGDTRIIPLGFALQLPRNTFGLLLPRSSSLPKRDILITPGVIDSEYRGEVKMVATNMHKYDSHAIWLSHHLHHQQCKYECILAADKKLTKKQHKKYMEINARLDQVTDVLAYDERIITPGETYCQLIILSLKQYLLYVAGHIDTTERGAGGFGSTGK